MSIFLSWISRDEIYDSAPFDGNTCKFFVKKLLWKHDFCLGPDDEILVFIPKVHSEAFVLCADPIRAFKMGWKVW